MEPPFSIEVRFLGGLTDLQMAVFAAAADRWVQMIVGDLPAVQIGFGQLIGDVMLEARGAPIDGVGQILGQAGPRLLRPATAGAAAGLPATGEMTFDTADLEAMEADGTLNDVIVHEMGHVLGIGTIWDLKGLLAGAGGINPTFVGENAMREYGELRGGGPADVPVENVGNQGTRDSHWRESIFVSELMTGRIAGPNNAISRVTVASLQDLGYVVDLDAAEPYMLPDLFALAEAGLLAPHNAPVERGIVLPTIPMVLPESALA
jgi:hypothetical protein